MDTSSLQTILSLGKESLYIFSKFNPFNADTPLIRTLSMGPSVSVLTGFDGMCFILSTALLICDEISCGICQQWMSFEINFLKSHHCLISELLLQFYLCLLILSILCHFFVEKCKGASFVWQDLWENWISWEGLLWFALHWWERWPGTVTAGITL